MPPVMDAVYKIVLASNPKLCVDSSRAEKEKDNLILYFNSNSSEKSNQHWRLV
jgi:hypothetical protein